MNVKMSRPHILRAELTYYKKVVEELGDYSVFIDCIEVRDECKKIKSFDDILLVFIERVKLFVNGMEPEEGYLKCMELASEIVLNRLTTDMGIIEDLKRFSTDILCRNKK